MKKVKRYFKVESFLDINFHTFLTTMTDFYKKLYGYDDDIQLKDDDIKLLETGMPLLKMKANKEHFNQRFYRLDLNNYQLIASTREFRKKEKICK